MGGVTLSQDVYFGYQKTNKQKKLYIYTAKELGQWQKHLGPYICLKILCQKI